jgi:hypothetical protein
MLFTNIFTATLVATASLVVATPVMFDWTSVDVVVYGREVNFTSQAQALAAIFSNLKTELTVACAPFSASVFRFIRSR